MFGLRKWTEIDREQRANLISFHDLNGVAFLAQIHRRPVLGVFHGERAAVRRSVDNKAQFERLKIEVHLYDVGCGGICKYRWSSSNNARSRADSVEVSTNSDGSANR